MNYTIATVSNRDPHEWYYLQKEFYKSLNGHSVLTINYTDDVWNGLTTKPKWLYRAIKENLINTEYLIFTDSWDLLFASKPEEVLGKYFMFDVDIVINAEKNCFPSDFKGRYNKECPTDYKYINSGFIVGKTEAILSCLESMDLGNVIGDHYDNEKKQQINPEDQSMWHEEYLKQTVSISLDYKCEISQTLHEANMEDFDFSTDRIRNKVTNSYPCVFHLNGSAKDKLSIREPILKHLNLL